MNKQRSVKQLSIGMVPMTGQTISLDSDLTLTDNFELDTIYQPSMPLDENGMFEYDLPVPFKQMFVYVMECLKGRFRYRINLKEYNLHENEAIIIYPGCIVDEARVLPGSKAFAISFQDSAFFDDETAQSVKVIRQNTLHPQVVSLRSAQTEMMLRLYQVLRSVCGNPAFEFKKDAVSGCLRIMAAGMAQWITENREPEVMALNRNEHLFVSFLQEVQVNCSKERKISYYAKKFCISPKYFAKLVYEASGRHASDWIRDYVILEAKAMLRTGEYTVQQVSEALHFPNSSFFGKYFKSAVGCSPRKYAIGKD